MPEPVVEEPVAAPSPEAEAETPEAPTTDFAALATEYQNRFAGSQRSLTQTQKERDALKAERDALADFKAKAERANMSEIEALQADLAREREAAAAARAEANRLALASKFPLTAAVLGDKMPSDEEALAALEQRLAAGPAAGSEPEPVIDPNNPRKTVTPALDPMEEVNRWMGDLSSSAWGNG